MRKVVEESVSLEVGLDVLLPGTNSVLSLSRLATQCDILLPLCFPRMTGSFGTVSQNEPFVHLL